MANTNTPTHNYANISVVPNGGSAITYTTGSANWATSTSIETFYPKRPKVEITDQDLVIDGLSLRETMLAVKNELMIPTRINRNIELEREFDELRAHADRYYELERKFLEQKKMWETLKK